MRFYPANRRVFSRNTVIQFLVVGFLGSACLFADDTNPIVLRLSEYTGNATSEFQTRIRRGIGTSTTIDDVNRVISILEARIGPEETKVRIHRALGDFLKLKPNSLRANIEFYERFIKASGVNDSLKRSVRGFWMTNPSQVQGVIETLLNKREDPTRPYLSHQEISERMKKDLLGFANTNAEKLQGVIETLQRVGLSPDQLRFLFQEQSYGALRLQKESLIGVTSLDEVLRLAELEWKWANTEVKLKELIPTNLTQLRISEAERLNRGYLSRGWSPRDSSLKEYFQVHPIECQDTLKQLVP